MAETEFIFGKLTREEYTSTGWECKRSISAALENYSWVSTFTDQHKKVTLSLQEEKGRPCISVTISSKKDGVESVWQKTSSLETKAQIGFFKSILKELGQTSPRSFMERYNIFSANTNNSGVVTHTPTAAMIRDEIGFIVNTVLPEFLSSGHEGCINPIIVERAVR